MNLLLDSHTFLWFVWNDAKLSNLAMSLITDPNNRKFVSIATCWEITIKTSLGKLSLGEPAGSFLPREITQNNFGLMPITMAHVTSIDMLPHFHRDPFDRLLITQAIIEKMKIISADGVFDQYPVNRVW